MCYRKQVTQCQHTYDGTRRCAAYNTCLLQLFLVVFRAACPYSWHQGPLNLSSTLLYRTLWAQPCYACPGAPWLLSGTKLGHDMHERTMAGIPGRHNGAMPHAKPFHRQVLLAKRIFQKGGVEFASAKARHSTAQHTKYHSTALMRSL